MAPRHPPRALCSLTSLNNSPNRQLPRDVRDHHLVVLSRQKSKFKKDSISSDHVFTLKGAAVYTRVSSDPLVGDLETLGSSPRTNRSRAADTTRRLEDHEPSSSASQGFALRERPGSTRYSVPSSGAWSAVCGPRNLPRWRKVVETRRLELLTLSLQRRCSSD